jgi:hypothetical protein
LFVLQTREFVVFDSDFAVVGKTVFRAALEGFVVGRPLIFLSAWLIHFDFMEGRYIRSLPEKCKEEFVCFWAWGCGHTFIHSFFSADRSR